ncbi:hypothetical protein BT67DRAFT_149715 [Trichocladium antarcticum]|uniref:Uncharacterized protein n=1 Tax=Trichocladium antarcticum TaxID=1450529 RepID=A0AAN6UEZ0_9PEZI|nr:hypothetical protein BT67DRAFT_149715 [Trichocladium antarcticum]
MYPSDSRVSSVWLCCADSRQTGERGRQFEAVFGDQSGLGWERLVGGGGKSEAGARVLNGERKKSLTLCGVSRTALPSSGKRGIGPEPGGDRSGWGGGFGDCFTSRAKKDDDEGEFFGSNSRNAAVLLLMGNGSLCNCGWMGADWVLAPLSMFCT